MLAQYRKHFAQALSKHIDLSVEELFDMIEIPPENIPGDFAFPCFKLSKLMKSSPQQIAADLETKLQSDHFSSFQNISGYLNANIKQEKFVSDIFASSQKKDVKQKEKVMIEYMNANPNKPLHIGQARNVCIGDSMRRIYSSLGYDVHAFNYGDDSGVNV